MTTAYTKHFNTQATPQTEPIPGSAQIANSAGGYSFAVDDWMRLDRFLILGSEGGSYYATERSLTVENAETVKRCILTDGARAVARIVEISHSGRAPKNDPAIFALAMALKLGDEVTRHAARDAVPKVCRIGTHIFQLAETVKAFGGWGRNTRAAFADWYTTQSADELALNLVKYQQRNGWSHLDLLRKAHPHAQTHEPLFRWLAKSGDMAAREVTRTKGADHVPIRTDKYGRAGWLPTIIGAFEEMKACTDAAAAVKLIVDHGLPRETVPTDLLKSPAVWEALLTSGRGMPMTAMIRNLGKMSSIGLLSPLSNTERFIVSRLGDVDALKKARVHPLSVLLAQSVYATGKGVRGDLAWTVSGPVTDALNDAFYAAFASIEPTGKRWFLGVDVSGSMDGGSVAGTPMTPRMAAAAMALVTARTESSHYLAGFASGSSSNRYGFSHDDTQLVPLGITPKTRLDDAMKIMRAVPMGGTDCALPMVEALRKKMPVDVFVVYTDNETYAGSIHPVQALREYRQKMGIAAKLIVVGIVSNEFTIADLNDGGMLDVCGMDASAPQAMAQFVAG